MKETSSRTALFGPYSLELRSGELRKFGTKLKIGEQPFQILLILLDRQGEMVTRDELRAKLWADDTFVDFDHGLNSAVQRLRDCLSDSAGSPRWVETIPRRGYRFIGQVEWSEKTGVSSALPQPRNESEEKQSNGAADVAMSQPYGEPEELVGGSSVVVPATQTATESSVWYGGRAAVLLAMLGLATLALLLPLAARWRRSAGTSVQSSRHTMLVVLPFENLSGDPKEDYFSDGLTEEIIAQLGALSPDQLGVIARTTSMAYKRTSKSAQQIARELDVDYILESSMRRDGDQMRITVQLIRASDQLHMWAHSYDRPVSHSISLQEEVAKAVAEQIRIKLSPAYGGSSAPRPVDAQANEAYLRGRYFGNQFTVQGYKKAITYFEAAIDRDPNFAEAYSGLADSYFFLVVTDAISPQEGLSKAEDAARRAVERGGGLAESHNGLGSVMFGTYQWSQAEAELKRAIELNPSYSTEHRIYAAVLTTLKRHDEAWQEINRAMRTDPLSLPNNAEVVRTLYYARDYDQAIEQAMKALQLAPDYYRTHFWLARVYAQKGMHKEAIAETERVLQAMPDSTAGLTEMAYILAVAGRQSEARGILRRLEEESKHNFVPAYNLAIIHTALDEKDTALQYLRKAYEEHDWALMVLLVEPRLDPLRSDPRFQELVAAVGLPRT